MSYNRILLGALTVGCLTFISHNKPAMAHVVESDQSIGAVLHIDPDDDPIAGEVSTFFFDIKDKTGRFQENNCLCKLRIQQDGQTLYEELFNQPGGGTYTFPSRGIYAVSAVGEPLTDGAFDSFSLDYTIRVERGAGQNTSSGQANERIPLVIAGIGAALFLFVFIRYKIVHSIK